MVGTYYLSITSKPHRKDATSSATAELARDADDVAFLWSICTVN